MSESMNHGEDSGRRDWASERSDRLARPSAIRMCDSPAPDGSQVDPLRGQFDQTDGHGFALFVRS
jgi:hypothetical protein